jgi:hypothetical protein
MTVARSNAGRAVALLSRPAALAGLIRRSLAAARPPEDH